MFILHDLWQGRISPIERSFRPGSEFGNLLHQSAELESQFCKTLNKDQKTVYEEIYDKQIRMMSIAEEECFIEGFQVGARMILDVLTNYQSSGIPLADS